MRKSGAARPHKRDGIWYLVKRVPAEFAALDQRKLIRISTNIAVADDPKGVRAKPVVAQLASELDAYWRGMRDGQSVEARRRFEAAQSRARSLGLPYMTNQELADGPAEAIYKRLRMLIDRNSVDNEGEVAAIMGGEERPAIAISELVTEYEALESQVLLGMSDNQVRKWRNPKKRALANLITVIGDKPITALTRDDAVQFRIWWQRRVVADGLDIGTANKDIGHISKMLDTIDMAHRLNLGEPFKRLRLSGEIAKQRAAFEATFVQERILGDGVLAELNEEARHLIYIVADTGLRPSEACNLDATTIKLDAAVPHVQVRAVGRKTKTAHSERDIPLVGVALAAMKLHPAGFPRYRDKSDSLSALVNKILGNRGLLPTGNHSYYSLRHTFEDRLTAVEAPEKVVASLMGHKWIRPKYGAGPSLDQKRTWLEKVAFTPPKHL